MARFRLMASAVLTMAIAGVPAQAQPAGSAPVVETAQGPVQGTIKNGVQTFLGIPFAAPPVGELRWQSPRPAPARAAVLQANSFSASCPQVLNPPAGRGPWTPEFLIPGPMSEDCLYLNVWRPVGPATKLPILFWIHGGGGVEGSTSVPAYDGANLARQGLVVVSVNYRLGVLANFSHPELSSGQQGASGNYALQDIVAALRWVHANAAAFGGDPSQVTISGQSAGAGFVTQLITSPPAKGLFVRAITQSGSQWGTRLPPRSPAEADAAGEQFGKDIGAPSLQALRAIPADQIIQKSDAYVKQGKGRFGAVLDHRHLSADPFTAQGAPGFNDTPILSGFNADEQSGSDPRYGSWTSEEFAAKRASLFGPAAQEAARFYPAADGQIGQTGIQMARDYTRGIMYEWIRRRAAHTKNPAYVYYFQHPLPGPTQARYGTFHSSEIPYVFGNFDAPRPYTEADRTVSARLMERWVNFIKTGDPNPAGYPYWEPYVAGKPAVMLLGDREAMEPMLPEEKLKLMDAMVEPGR